MQICYYKHNSHAGKIKYKEGLVIQVNASTLVRRNFEEGIEIFPSNGRHYEVRIGQDHDYRRVWMGTGPHETRPRISTGDMKLLRAKVIPYKGGPPLVNPERDWKGILVRIIARDLDFGHGSLAKDFLLFAGGEGRQAVVSYGRFRDIAVRDQLFELREGESILVSDHCSAVNVLTCRAGIPIMRPVTMEEMVRYLKNIATTTPRVAELVWAIRSLSRLGFADLQAFEKRLERLRAPAR